MMFKLLLIFFFTFLIFGTRAENKDKIINNLNNTSSFSFEFEQNINGKIEEGKCTVKYPKKMYCAYNKNDKKLISNGKSLVIKTVSSYYRYPLKKTPLNLILDKNYLINKIHTLNENIIDNSYVNYTIIENEIKIDIFFDINSLELIGWQTKDVYQNTTMTLINLIAKNENVKKNLFRLPDQN